MYILKKKAADKGSSKIARFRMFPQTLPIYRFKLQLWHGCRNIGALEF